jgi:hypothetical protein
LNVLFFLVSYSAVEGVEYSSNTWLNCKRKTAGVALAAFLGLEEQSANVGMC